MALTDGLLRYYKMDSTTDSTGNSNLTLDDAPTLISGGIIGSAYDFESADSNYATFSLSSSTDTAQTISMWVKPETVANNYAVMTDRLAMFYWTPTNSVYPFMYAGNGVTRYRANFGSSTQMTAGNWYHVVVASSTVTGTQVCWFNGTKYTASVGTDGTTNNYTPKIGANNAATPTVYFDGIIDEVGIWNRALTDAEASTLYNGGSGLTYPFSGDSGWTGDINGVTDPESVSEIDSTSITEINEQ